MKKAYKSIIPIVAFAFLFTTLICCCIGKMALASLAKHPCCQKEKSAQQHGPQIKDHTKISCECPTQMPATIAGNSSSQTESELVFLSGKTEKMLLALLPQEVDLSAIGFSPQYSFSSQKSASLPLYLKNSVLRI